MNASTRQGIAYWTLVSLAAGAMLAGWHTDSAVLFAFAILVWANAD